MRIAIFLDFVEVTENMSREGIIVFLKNAIRAWLKYDQDITFELWCKPNDKRIIYNCFIDLFEECRDRVDFYPKKILKRDLTMGKELRIGIIGFIQGIVHMVIPFTKYGKRMGERTIINREIYRRSRLELSRIFNRESKADIAYLPYIELEGALGINRPVVMQIHDLYIFLIRDLFEKEMTEKMNIDEWENITISRMNKYVKQGAYFQTSSEFTKREEILKYVKSIEDERCRIISFPPMIKEFDENNILSENDFRNKYKIGNYKYIAFPSQNRPGKNLITLLKALKEINRRGWNLRLVTTGSMQTVNSTAEYVKTNKDLVIEIGHIPEADLTALYKYCSLVVCPNVIEGQLVSDQAVSALKIGGIPIIHGRSLGIEEAMNRIGLSMETADMNWFDLFDVNNLVNKMEMVLREPKKTIEKQKVIAEAYKKQTWDKFAAESISFYKEVIKQYYKKKGRIK